MALGAGAYEYGPHIFPHGMESLDCLGRIHDGVTRLDGTGSVPMNRTRQATRAGFLRRPIEILRKSSCVTGAGTCDR